MTSEWQTMETAPVGVEIMTKIHDEHGERNIQALVKRGGLYWTPDDGMYVYYTPTHWKPVDRMDFADD
jgi:hypothetical protein